MVARLGILDSDALIIPPSAASEKVTPVASGLMPNPNEVRRFEDRPDVLFRVTATERVLEPNPDSVKLPVPDRRPAALS